jgi:hypothetical protein
MVMMVFEVVIMCPDLLPLVEAMSCVWNWIPQSLVVVEESGETVTIGGLECHWHGRTLAEPSLLRLQIPLPMYLSFVVVVGCCLHLRRRNLSFWIV